MPNIRKSKSLVGELEQAREEQEERSLKRRFKQSRWLNKYTPICKYRRRIFSQISLQWVVQQLPIRLDMVLLLHKWIYFLQMQKILHLEVVKAGKHIKTTLRIRLKRRSLRGRNLSRTRYQTRFCGDPRWSPLNTEFQWTLIKTCTNQP